MSVRDVDNADVIALVRHFMLFCGDDERVAFDLRAPLVEVAQIFAVFPKLAGLLDLRLIVAVVETSVPEGGADVVGWAESLFRFRLWSPRDDLHHQIAPGERRVA